jgi:hypothetical protein
MNGAQRKCLAGSAAELLHQGGYLHGGRGDLAYRTLTQGCAGSYGKDAVQKVAAYAPVAVATLGLAAPYLAAGMAVIWVASKLYGRAKD